MYTQLRTQHNYFPTVTSMVQLLIRFFSPPEVQIEQESAWTK